MRPLLIVVRPPAFDQTPRVVERGEPVRVQAFIAQLAVEALDHAVLS